MTQKIGPREQALRDMRANAQIKIKRQGLTPRQYVRAVKGKPKPKASK